MNERERFPWSMFSVDASEGSEASSAADAARVRDDSIDRLPKLERGDRVRVLTGIFAGYEGEVKSIDERWGTVTIQIEIFGRSVPVECGRSHLEIATSS